MTGDAPQDSGSSTSGGAAGGGELLVGFLGGLGGGALTGGGGGGRMGARGVAQAGLLQQFRAMRQGQIGLNLSFAEAGRASHFAPGEKSILVQQQTISPAMKKIGDTLATLSRNVASASASAKAMKGAQHQQLALQRKLAHLAARQPVPTYEYVAAYGLNNGPPLAGSRF